MNKVAIGRVVLTNREHIIAPEPLEKGLIGTLLRYLDHERPLAVSRATLRGPNQTSTAWSPINSEASQMASSSVSQSNS
jgi:non-homologous end joining protein Ku